MVSNNLVSLHFQAWRLLFLFCWWKLKESLGYLGPLFLNQKTLQISIHFYRHLQSLDPSIIGNFITFQILDDRHTKRNLFHSVFLVLYKEYHKMIFLRSISFFSKDSLNPSIIGHFLNIRFLVMDTQRGFFYKRSKFHFSKVLK